MNKPKDVLKDALLMSVYVSATHVYVCIEPNTKLYVISQRKAQNVVTGQRKEK